MQTIHQFELAVTDEQTLMIPLLHALTVQVQHGRLCLWAIVETDNDPLPVTVRIVGTGHPFTLSLNRLTYLGTVQMATTAKPYGRDVTAEFVWHVFLD
jgi:hypothetical protein